VASFLSAVLEMFKRRIDHADEPAIREELFSVERLEQYAQLLASEHLVIRKKGRALLLPRLEDNGQKLVAAYRTLCDAIRMGRTISPAAEWLVDNFHIVEDQLREIREDLPKGYYHELPKLAQGELKFYPRIYVLALALIAHTDSRLHTNTLRRFIAAYQTVSPLTIGELWAVAISLRLALVENLRRLAVRIVGAREEREQADKVADKLLELASRQPSGLIPLIKDHLGKREKIPRAFVVQLTQRLREQDPAVMTVIDWLERQLAQQGTSVEQVIHIEHQRQAAAQVTVGNIITSMRLLSNLDWKDFFESVSLIDPLLGKDPTGDYLKMEFATRDRYRHVIERISKRTEAPELEIGAAAVEMAAKAKENSGDWPEAHVGYYLIGLGRFRLEAAFKYTPTLGERLRRWSLQHPTVAYLGSLSLLTLSLIGLLLAILNNAGAGWPLLLAVALLALIPASDLALSVVNWDITHSFEPRLLPRMNTSKGIPEEARTFVVVPTIFSNQDSVRELLEGLEVNFLANQDEHIYFALLSDFPDANSEETPYDHLLINSALDGIQKLNQRYSQDQPLRFHLFHRKRQWNASEGKWMGWERKRGKLHEFNQLLRGRRDTSFTVQTAERDLLASVQYVITLDSDTQLPREVARKLVGTAIHPLNRPRIDTTVRRVTFGYGILQPRVSIALEGAARSRFSRIFSGNTGIDPYTTAVSDVYQDLFGEGNYTGKGLYDVDAFEYALSDRVPSNSLLSHDLFESLFARAALVSDIELLDGYPPQYESYAKRQHRWTRGDWQLIRWLFPSVKDANGRKVPNDLPLISRWKILDNMRRSLVAPSIFLWLLATWLILPGSTLLLSLLAVLTVAFPVYLHVTTSLLLHPRGIPWTSHFWSVWGDIRSNTAQVALSVIFLAHQAYLMSDAIVRTLYRKAISRRKLLEWMTAAQAERETTNDVIAVVRFMMPAQLLTLVAAALTIYLRPEVQAVMWPFIVAWALAPVVAYWVSLPTPTEIRAISGTDVLFARLVARRTWRFFETFVGEADNWLPPDNYQEDPVPLVANRTSPTNIGLLLLSTISAHNFGYISLLELVERQELTFATLRKLAKYRGHFFNWYDTKTLQPLHPQYISTVDSGNLCGHLIAVRQAFIETPDEKLFDQRTLAGLRDTVEAISAEAAELAAIRQRTEVVTVGQLQTEIEACLNSFTGSPTSILSWQILLKSVADRSLVIEDIVEAFSLEYGPENFKDLHWWAGTLRHQVGSYRRDLTSLLSWAPALLHADSILKEWEGEGAKAWAETAELLSRVPTLAAIPEVTDSALLQLAALRARIEEADETVPRRESALNALTNLTTAIESASGAARTLLSRLANLALTADQIAAATDFDFLLDKERKLFTIGFNFTEQQPDNSFYDLLASEARLASFVAIAKGDVTQDHWFRMGRQLIAVNGDRALISWTGTMFEYLMPLLVMRNYPDTLLDQTYRAIVAKQIDYGRERGVPWGISESAYNVRDLHLNYQYGPFGVAGLGLKRGLIEDLVIAPYATMLAAPIFPRPVMENLRRLEREGALGSFGFYEAIDYTPERLPQNQKRVLIRAFMTHHQGMSLVSLDNALHDGRMEKLFHSDPSVQATELLLQERIPIGVPAVHPRAEEVLTGRLSRSLPGMITRVYASAELETPRTQLLSNGTYNVMITTAGSGYSRCGPNAVTRWNEDVTRDHWGTFIYLRDVRSGAVWSAGVQPVLRIPQSYEVAFSEDKIDIWRSDAGLVTHTEVVVSAEDNAEVRRVSISNNTLRTREIEITSYAEVVLVPPEADAAHPAFSNLFIETEFFAAESAILARRRPRSSEDQPIWGVHAVVAEGDAVGAVQFETDRGRFLGRGHTAADPVSVMEDRPLSNTVGAVLDPIFSLRQRVRVRPNQTVRVSFSTAVAKSREEAITLADKYHDPGIFERESRLAWTKSQVEMNHLKIDADEAHLFQRLAARIIYSDPSLRPRPHVLALNTKAQSSLWPYGISGDLPILLVRISRAIDLPILRKIMRGHEYLAFKGLRVDLVILNDHPSSYIQSLQHEIETIVRASAMQSMQDKPGGVFLRRADIMPEADRILLHAVARAVIVTERGTLEDQLQRKPVEEELPRTFVPRLPSQSYPEPTLALPELAFFNGIGGFHQSGREYVIVLGAEQWTPAPWVNVVANSQEFGFQVTETGAGYTWSVNSRENRLTPWSNDAVSDPAGEIIYLRDEETGAVWSVTPLPIRELEHYTVRHGQGYTVFEHTSHGISQELLMFVPLDAPVKISLLRLRNRSDRTRQISITLYNELVLGFHRSSSAPYIITEIDKSGAIYAQNPFNNEFADRVAFVASSEKIFSATCDRKEFLGRNGSLAGPAALRRTRLGNRDGAGLDPCAALQTTIQLEPHEGREIIFILGEESTRENAAKLISRFTQPIKVNEAFENVLSYWDDLLGTVEVKTPDAALDVMLNRWLLYQALSCRIWARSAFYQSGGAFGFRDQLQDVMAFVGSRPSLTREQIMLAAGHQFKEGDVQHWWHPPTGRGVRTRFSDDLLWLPFVTAFYIQATGDYSVLDEEVAFLEAPLLEPDEHESYTQPQVSKEAGSIFEHCTRAIDRSLKVGVHGLPLMGGGDWNDGMNRVGHLGKGESIWVAWFLYTTLAGFVPVCEQRKQKARARRYKQHMENLKQALEESGWDGDWYRRAYFDDGTPLGSCQNEECRIDSIVQSWSVISGAADEHRQVRSMAAVEQYLIRRGDGLVILFTPPFDKSSLNPGYIKGYVPGVRENGGQYTHAALWTLIAFAMLGDGDRAGELFSLLNPINHASTRAGVHKYKVEPYVAVGDVYAVPPHTGRGGWTWYTGSAGWMYRAGLESILGFKLQGDHLLIDPCVPRWWQEFEITYRRPKGTYRIKVENPMALSRGVARVELDGTEFETSLIPLVDDGQTHLIRVVLGEKPQPSGPEAPETEAQEEQTSSSQ